MKHTLRRLPNDHKTADYVCEYLRCGGAMSQVALREMSRWTWENYVLLPANYGGPLPNLSHGGIGGLDGIIETLAQLLEFDALLHRRSILIEHPLAKQGDPFLKEFPSPATIIDNSVFILITSNSASLAKIVSAVSACLTALGIALFVFPDATSQFNHERQTWSLPTLFEAVDLVVLGAFDNETFLVLQRGDRN